MNKKIILCLVLTILASALFAVALTPQQTQYYWKCMEKDGCLTLLKNKQYTPYRTCALKCLDKAGDYTPEQNWCSDNDNGLDYFNPGTVFSKLYPEGKKDYCQIFPNGKIYLMEGICQNNNYIYAQQKCLELGQYECSQGACITAKCTDSDGGNNYYLKGTAEGINDPQLGGFTTATDKCEGNVLYESVCTTPANALYKEIVGLEKYECPNGCQEGACLKKECESDSIKVNLKLKEKLSSVKPVFEKTDLPKLLKSGIYINKKGNFPYTQKLFFETDSVFSEGIEYFTPEGIGDYYFYVHDDTQIARYELDFTSPIQSQINGTFLNDFQNTTLEMLGVKYTIVIAKRFSPGNIWLTIMKEPLQDYILENEEKTYFIDGKLYKIKLGYISPTSAKFKINGETTDKLKVGDIKKLSGGKEIGVSEILYQDYAGGVHSATFFLGNLLMLIDNNINDDFSSAELVISSETIDGAKVIIKGIEENNLLTISSIEMEMIAESNYYVPVGGLLSDSISSDSISLLSDSIKMEGEEKEVLFANNWDIKFNNYYEAEEKGIIEIGRWC